MSERNVGFMFCWLAAGERVFRMKFESLLEAKLVTEEDEKLFV